MELVSSQVGGIEHDCDVNNGFVRTVKGYINPSTYNVPDSRIVSDSDHVESIDNDNHLPNSALQPTGYINRSNNVCSGVEHENLASCFNIAPRYLKFAKSKNVDLRTMRMPNLPTMAGYNPFRGDFEVEYDNNAEDLVCLAGSLHDCVNFENSEKKTKETKEIDKLLSELQVTLVQCYNSRLKERQKRKEIIKNFGLLNQKGTHRWYTKLQNSLGKSNTKKLMRFSPLLPVLRIEYLFTSLQNLYEKRALLNKLVFFRTQYGVTTKTSLDLVENYKKKERTCERVDIRNLITPSTVKRNQSPLDIFHLPRYRELTALEAEFCSMNNFVPDFFLDTKDHLIADCSKHNGMLLKKARKLVKIDVNKTRKIFDFLMEQGLIWPPPK